MGISILGGGKWGTALAVMYGYKFDSVNLWVYPGETVFGESLPAFIQRERYNPVAFHEIEFPKSINVSGNLDEVVDRAEIVILAIPSAFLEQILKHVATLDFQQFVNCSKGVLKGKPISESFMRIMLDKPYAVISGPNIAQQVIANFQHGARPNPSFASIAYNPANSIDNLVDSLRFIPYFRLYPALDIGAVEYCGILKQVYAISLGICVGMGYDGNTVAGVFHACGREIKRIIEFVGHDPRTYDETYAGYPDLEVTYKFGRHGKFGGLIASKGVEGALMEMGGETLEGLEVVEAMHKMTENSGLHLPILKEMYSMLSPEIRRNPEESIRNLLYPMNR